MKILKITSLILIIAIVSCKTKENNDSNNNQKIDLGKQSEINKDLLIADKKAVSIADSITYITNVINPNPEDAYYIDSVWLKGAKIQILANQIFKNIYEGKLKAYDYMSGKEMTLKDVEELEKNHKREDIGQILFTEDWYFNEKELKMYKQVNSLMLAYFRYDDSGYVIGNNPGVRVYFNNTKPMIGAEDY